MGMLDGMGERAVTTYVLGSVWWGKKLVSRRGCAVRLRLCSSMPETRTRGQLATGPSQVQADPRIRPEIRRVSDNKVFNQRFGW